MTASPAASADCGDAPCHVDGRRSGMVHSTAVLAFSCAATALATAAATRVLSRSLRLRSLATAAAAPDAPDASARAPAIAMTERTDAADLVQFVVVRRDLLTSLSWPVGSVIAQACHACTAVSWSCRDDADVQAYLQAEDSMTKVVKECKGEKQLLALAGAPGALAAGSRTRPSLARADRLTSPPQRSCAPSPSSTRCGWSSLKTSPRRSRSSRARARASRRCSRSTACSNETGASPQLPCPLGKPGSFSGGWRGRGARRAGSRVGERRSYVARS